MDRGMCRECRHVCTLEVFNCNTLVGGGGCRQACRHIRQKCTTWVGECKTDFIFHFMWSYMILQTVFRLFYKLNLYICTMYSASIALPLIYKLLPDEYIMFTTARCQWNILLCSVSVNSNVLLHLCLSV